MKKYQLTCQGFILSLFILLFNIVQAQDLEPGFLSSMPTGTNVALAAYSFSKGNILIDNSLPIENLESEINMMLLAYARGFNLFNKLTKIDAIIPYGKADFSALVESENATTSRQGFGDPSFRISMILIGEQALSPADFFSREKRKFKLATLFKVAVPLGDYDKTKLINLGTNRFTFRLGVAGSYAVTPKLTWELYFKSNFFTENSSFYNGNTLKQKPLLTFQTHLSYEFKPGIWTAISFGKSQLGETSVNGVEKDNIQKNTRTGFVFSYALAKQHSLKAIATTGVTTRYGSDYTTYMLAYQYLWMDKRK